MQVPVQSWGCLGDLARTNSSGNKVEDKMKKCKIINIAHALTVA